MTRKRIILNSLDCPQEGKTFTWNTSPITVYPEGMGPLRCCPAHNSKCSQNACIIQSFLQWGPLWSPFQNESRYLKMIPKKKLAFLKNFNSLVKRSFYYAAHRCTPPCTALYEFRNSASKSWEEIGCRLFCDSKITNSWKDKLLVFLC